MPLVSVIIPAYNAESYLDQCLDSLSMQTFEDFEVIVVDDGSTDSSASIANGYEHMDERFRLIRQKNGGVSKARNVGIDEAKGRYITFVDADDALHPKALAAMYGALRDNEAQVCITALTRFSKDWRTNGVRVSRRQGSPEKYLYPEAMKLALYQKRMFNSPGGMMMERRLLGDNLRFREGTRYEDLDAFYRFYENAAAIVYLPFTYYFYRENPESFLSKWSEARLDVLDVADGLFDYMSGRYPDLKWAAADRRFSAHYNLLLLMMKNGIRNPEAKERCLKVIKEGRGRALSDRNVRFKNKMGALASYGGEGILRLLSRLYSGK